MERDDYWEWDESKGRLVCLGTDWPKHWGRNQNAPVVVGKRDDVRIVEGMACLYGKVHPYRDAFEVFLPGCFSESLSEKTKVVFSIDHDQSVTLGDTRSNLELIDSEDGLAFRLKSTADDLTKLSDRERMSVFYRENEVDEQTIDGEKVRFIKRATLLDISAVYRGAIKQTFLTIRDNETGPLDVKSIASESVAVEHRRVLEEYSEAMHAYASARRRLN